MSRFSTRENVGTVLQQALSTRVGLPQQGFELEAAGRKQAQEAQASAMAAYQMATNGFRNAADHLLKVRAALTPPPRAAGGVPRTLEWEPSGRRPQEEKKPLEPFVNPAKPLAPVSVSGPKPTPPISSDAYQPPTAQETPTVTLRHNPDGTVDAVRTGTGKVISGPTQAPSVATHSAANAPLLQGLSGTEDKTEADFEAEGVAAWPQAKKLMSEQGVVFTPTTHNVIQSNSSDCLPAAFATALNLLGKGGGSGVEQLKGVMGTGGGGTRLEGVEAAASQTGVAAERTNFRKSGLPDNGLAVMGLRLPGTASIHAVTVDFESAPAGMVLVMDPQAGSYMVPKDLFRSYIATDGYTLK